MRDYYSALYNYMCEIRGRLTRIALARVRLEHVRYGKEKIKGSIRVRTQLLGLPFRWCAYHKEIELSVYNYVLRDCNTAFRMIIHFNDFAYSIRTAEDLDHALESIVTTIQTIEGY